MFMMSPEGIMEDGVGNATFVFLVRQSLWHAHDSPRNFYFSLAESRFISLRGEALL